MRVQDLAEEFTAHRDQVHQRLDQVNESIEARFAAMEAQLREFMSWSRPQQLDLQIRIVLMSTTDSGSSQGPNRRVEDGAAGDWFQWIFNCGTVQTWEEFTKAVRQRFGSSHYRDVRGVLAKLTQNGSLADYMREFQRFMNQVHDLSDNLLMILFISGLQPDLQGAIQLHRPTSLHQAMQLALAYDSHHSELRSSFTNHTKKSFHRPHSPTKTEKATPLAIQSSQALALPAPPTLPVRKLSSEEIQKKRELDICFTCDEKWTARHRCNAKMMLLIGEVEDSGGQQEEEIVRGLEEPKGTRIDAALNSLSGSNNLRSIQLQASILNQGVKVLVDSGSSHNFIRRRLAEELRLPMKKSSKMRVFIGMHWLTQLGKVTHDYNNLSMEFVWLGIPVKLSGCQQQGKELSTEGMEGECNTLSLQPVEEAQAKEIAYLGHVVTISGVKADPRKLSAITDWPTPHSIKQLRAFLGLTGYYRRFVQHYASIAHPLTELLKQDRFSWTPEADVSFQKLKVAMSTTPVLNLPYFSSSFVIESDASKFGIGVVLLQNGKPISFFSKKLGVKMAIASAYTPEQQKCMSKLLGYSFSIEYKTGLSNVVADSLSRQHDDMVHGTALALISEPKFDIINQIKSENSADQDLLAIHQSLVKTSTQAPMGLLNPLPIPEAVFDDLTLDFITALPKSQGFTTILVVVDRLTKYGHFGPFPASYTASTVAQLFCNMIVKLHRFPRSFVSDRDPIFLSNFWRKLFQLSGTKLHATSAYHPQSDGQTEVTNRYIEQYLRAFCSEKNHAWSSYLCWAELHYNTSFHSSINTSPFQALYGRAPVMLPMYPRGLIKIEALNTLLQKRNEVLASLKLNLQRAQHRMKLQADRHR
ncbi:uncharacterized protein LOC133316534 [Gastrolobium bilobum]|uniref:uncharacterized protein LOC133316534 n=1 Tax=Gastrolobium bilobum TaxID=150636 RepID=UPI002AB236CB|nr:uncharacterized protein LOC133316534 [Gastrolobium bilobum]